MAVRGNGSRSSLTIDELRWLSACSAFADAPSSPRSPSSPIPIPAKRSSSPTEGITVGINDSLTLLRTKGLSRRHYQKSTKSSRAKAGGTASAFPDSSSLLYKVTPPAPAIPPSPVETSSAPASPVASSLPSKQSRNPRLIQPHRSPRSPSLSHNQGADFPPTARSAPSPRQFSKHPEWIYRRPKLSSSSSSCQSGENDLPRTRAPLPSFTSGPCLERRNKPGYSPSNESSFNRDFNIPHLLPPPSGHRTANGTRQTPKRPAAPSGII
ncbi:hypothetical protein CPB85DRAFT_1427497 [Mucidula mucida]|nr:hypothetical protein CPB85DRAFT_1427497 [Mucidula mucida]